MNYKILAIASVMCFSISSFPMSGGKASGSNNEIDSGYRKLSACEKQGILWKKIKETKHDKLPQFAGKKNIIFMLNQYIKPKVDYKSDFAPKGWKKYIHKRGSVAKIKYVSTKDHKYTGVFTGAECGLLRLSLTYKPKDRKVAARAVAPGLAMKILRDGTHSANISALYTLGGQAQNYNFFTYPLSNIVPVGTSYGEQVMNWIFSKVSKYPEQLRLDSLSQSTQKGEKIESPISPKQIFFVPNKDIKFNKRFHDVRSDFVTIKPGTVLYEVHALIPEEVKKVDFAKYKTKDIPAHVENSVQIGELILSSEFVSSEFGDTGMFFKHDA
jgi:hypothetical protein